MQQFTQPRGPAIKKATGVDSHDEPIQGAEEEIVPGLAKAGVILDEVAAMPKKELDVEAFMAQELEVAFTEPGNESDPQFVEVNVNGDYRMARRDGNPVTMRRYHLAVLAQAKQGRVRQDKIVNADGSMGYRDKTILSLSYPFQVFMDPAGKRGADWLKSILRSPG